MIRQDLAYGIRNPWMNDYAKGFRNPFGNSSLQAFRVSGFGHRPSYRQSRIHGHDDQLRFAIRRYRRFRLGLGKGRHEMPVAGGDQ